mmetsp:Transcript_32732/g.49327  ORF Transcript_32732/g.49327 Transcript_32732/m.49327 type:complete len:452 (+) Transcript_32732:87-1442(+)
MKLFFVLAFSILALVFQPHYGVKAQTCDSEDGTCSSDGSTKRKLPANQELQLKVTNKSNYRVDVHWDDGKFGSLVSTLEAKGGNSDFNTFAGHGFFVTRHGVKEGLFDPETDKQLKYKMSGETEIESWEIPKNAAPSKNKCQDRFSICEQYSKNGGCWNSPGWMIVHCCRSCDEELDASRLLDPKVRCSKENLNVTGPTWEPGDLNTLFTSWATDPKFKEYEPVVLSSPTGVVDGKPGDKKTNDPWVITFDKFLTSAEADALVRGGESIGFERSTNQGAVNDLGEQERVVSTTRTSSNAWCVQQCENQPEVRSVSRRIEDVTGVPQKNYESFQILNYGVNEFYRMHHDSSGSENVPPGNRILTFFLYLSDVEEGGETQFNKLGVKGLKVKPKKGRALIWPSVKDDNPHTWDPRMYHEAMPVIKGKKYAANHWIHLYDYVGPNEWGCTGSFS